MVNEWLKNALEKSGMTQAELARRMAAEMNRIVPRTAVNKMVLGKQKIAADEMLTISKITGFDMPAVTINHLVPVVGHVSAGAIAVLFGEGQGPYEMVIAPEGSTRDTVAVEVRGTSLGVLFDRWLVFYDNVRRPPTEELFGELCVVGLAGNGVVVKQLMRGQLPGRFNLISNTEPPVYDVQVEWAALVTHMSRKRISG